MEILQSSLRLEALGLSTGGTPTSRNRLKEDKLLAIKIPLPPLAEQLRIVARTEELAAKIKEARRLQQDVASECDTMCRSLIFSKFNGNSPVTRMGELLSLKSSDVVVNPYETYHFAGVYCFGGGVFKGPRKTGMDFAYPRLTRLRTGNFVYPKLMAWEGALGVVPAECDGLVVSPEFPVFEVNQDRVLPETLDTYFRTPSIWPLLANISTGTNVRRRRLHPANFLKFEMPLPSMTVQHKLRGVRAKANTVKSLQTITAFELDTLPPSIINEVFSGNP